ncbi:hypothetical protein MRK42_18575 [Aeromonas sp. 19NY04SH05-1]|uniref:Transposase n=1 Tax=Aeromonas sp. 19NY04SH05-1 TaxID=2920537 RepID=A0AAU6T758_9GAMM
MWRKFERLTEGLLAVSLVYLPEFDGKPMAAAKKLKSRGFWLYKINVLLMRCLNKGMFLLLFKQG